MAYIIRRQVEVCPHCGAWNSFRKGKRGKSLYEKSTRTRRIYGECARCGARLVVIYSPPAEKISE